MVRRRRLRTTERAGPKARWYALSDFRAQNENQDQEQVYIYRVDALLVRGTALSCQILCYVPHSDEVRCEVWF